MTTFLVRRSTFDNRGLFLLVCDGLPTLTLTPSDLIELEAAVTAAIDARPPRTIHRGYTPDGTEIVRVVVAP